MSLVNDMLRDLDHRRQESTQAKFGVERLVPVVSDSSSSKVNRSFVSFVLSIVITLALIIGGLYFWQSLTSYITKPSLVQPVATLAPAASVAPSIEQRELEQISQRMQELEAQNRALKEAQSVIATQANATQSQLDEEIAQPSMPEPMPQQVEAEAIAALPPSAAEIAPALEAQQTSSPQVDFNASSDVVHAPEEAATSGVIRSPRTLSFAERDQVQVQEALSLASSNQNERAMQQLSEFLNANPNAHNSREAMIKLALQKGDTIYAEQLLQSGLSIDASRPAYLKLEARMMLSSGKAEQAMQLLISRVPAIEDDLEYHDILATAYLSVQDYENAAHSYEALVQQNRGEGRWWYGLASAWENLGRTRDAGLAYEQALKLPNLSAALRQRSQQRIVELNL